MWIVQPDPGDNGLDVIHLDTMLRGAHLIGVANGFTPKIKFTESLDAFKAFYVNKYADYHTHETVILTFCFYLRVLSDLKD